MRVFSCRVRCSTVAPDGRTTRFTLSYRRLSVITFILKRVISGSSLIVTACSSSVVQHSLRLSMMALTRSSRRDADSRASTVFSKVGSALLHATASTLRSASAMAARTAGS